MGRVICEFNGSQWVGVSEDGTKRFSAQNSDLLCKIVYANGYAPYFYEITYYRQER